MLSVVLLRVVEPK